MGNPQATDPPARQSPKLVFIVDDEPILLELASSILSAGGFQTETFTDPAAALKAFAAANPRPALIITDYAMGRWSGTDLIRECRRIVPAQKIILLSGTADESVFASSPFKPDRFMAKPYGAADLIKVVNAVLAVTGGNHPI